MPRVTLCSCGKRHWFLGIGWGLYDFQPMQVTATSSWLAAAHLTLPSTLLEITTLISNRHELHVLIKTQVNSSQLSSPPPDCYNNVNMNQQQFHHMESEFTKLSTGNMCCSPIKNNSWLQCLNKYHNVVHAYRTSAVYYNSPFTCNNFQHTEILTVLCALALLFDCVSINSSSLSDIIWIESSDDWRTLQR